MRLTMFTALDHRNPFPFVILGVSDQLLEVPSSEVRNGMTGGLRYRLDSWLETALDNTMERFAVAVEASLTKQGLILGEA